MAMEYTEVKNLLCLVRVKNQRVTDDSQEDFEIKKLIDSEEAIYNYVRICKRQEK